MHRLRSFLLIVASLASLAILPSDLSAQTNWYAYYGSWSQSLVVPPNAVALKSFDLPFYGIGLYAFFIGYACLSAGGVEDCDMDGMYYTEEFMRGIPVRPGDVWTFWAYWWTCLGYRCGFTEQDCLNSAAPICHIVGPGVFDPGPRVGPVSATFVTNPVTTPEPGTIALLGPGLVGLGLLRRRRRRRR